MTILSNRKQRRLEAKRIKRQQRILAMATPDSFHFTATGVAEVLATAGDDQSPTFEIQAYSGGLLPVAQFKFPVVLVLASAKFADTQTPILRDHKGDRPVGHTEEQTINAEGITLKGHLSVPGNDRDAVVEAAQQGFKWKASIGAKGFRTEFVEPGRKVTANGKSVRGPVILAHGATIYETSILAIAADSSTNVRVAASERETNRLVNEEQPMTFSEWIEANGWNETELEENQLTVLRAAYQSDQSTNPDPPTEPNTQPDDEPVDLVAQQREELLVERQRVREIDRICAEYGDPNVEIDGNDVLLSEHAISEGLSTERTELLAMRAERPAPAIHSHTSDNAADVIECSLLMAAGRIQRNDYDDFFVAEYGEEVANRAGDSVNRYSLHRLMHEVIRAAGMNHPMGVNDNDFIRKALEASQKLEASGFSSLSLPLITRNALNKQMLRSFQRETSAIPIFMRRDTTTDFKPYYSYRIDGKGKFEQLSATGEIKHAGLIETEFTNQLETYAKMLALTRKLLINDDMSALLRAGDMLAQMAHRAREIAAINLLMNPPNVGGTPYFDASRNNLITGAGSALSIAGLDAAETAWGNKVDGQGYPVTNEASRILATRANKGVLSDLMSERFVVVDGTGSTSNRRPQNNRHAGMFSISGTSPYISNATHITGNSTTAWFQFADPEALAAFAIGYLNGREEPFVEVVDAAPNQLGVNYRGYLDFGVAAEEPLGALRSDGA